MRSRSACSWSRASFWWAHASVYWFPTGTDLVMKAINRCDQAVIGWWGALGCEPPREWPRGTAGSWMRSCVSKQSLRASSECWCTNAHVWEFVSEEKSEKRNADLVALEGFSFLFFFTTDVKWGTDVLYNPIYPRHLL